MASSTGASSCTLWPDSIVTLTAPGVQMFETEEAVALARLANDRLAERVAAHPTRYAGLASFAPQDPAEAAREIARAKSRMLAHRAHTVRHGPTCSCIAQRAARTTT